MSEVSGDYYVDNSLASEVESLHLALCSRRVALETTVMDVRQNPPDSGIQGSHVVTMRVKYENGDEKVIRRGTDFIVNASGFGVPKSGLNERNPVTKKIIEKGKKPPNGEILKFTDTLGFFKEVSDRRERFGLSRVAENILIIGDGNSMDTLIELIAGIVTLLSDKNPSALLKLKKVFVVGNLPENCEDFIVSNIKGRPRYSQLSNVIERVMRAGLVTFIKTRASDLRCPNPTASFTEQRIIPLDPDGNEIKTKDGKVVEVEQVISAAGFQSTLDQVYSSYVPKEGKEVGAAGSTEEGQKEIERLFNSGACFQEGAVFYLKQGFLRYSRLKINEVITKGISDEYVVELHDPVDANLQVPKSRNFKWSKKILRKNLLGGVGTENIEFVKFIAPPQLRDALQYVTLPGGSDITLADTLDNGRIVFCGVSTRKNFDPKKLEVIPKASGEVLRKVGEANAVAIGFLGPDTEATMRVVLDLNRGIQKIAVEEGYAGTQRNLEQVQFDRSEAAEQAQQEEFEIADPIKVAGRIIEDVPVPILLLSRYVYDLRNTVLVESSPEFKGNFTGDVGMKVSMPVEEFPELGYRGPQSVLVDFDQSVPAAVRSLLSDRLRLPAMQNLLYNSLIPALPTQGEIFKVSRNGKTLEYQNFPQLELSFVFRDGKLFPQLCSSSLSRRTRVVELQETESKDTEVQ